MYNSETINCHFPLKLRFLGEPTEDDWLMLEARLTDLYTTQLRRSLTQLMQAGYIPEQEIREPFDPARMTAEGYIIPSYQDAQPTTIPVTSPSDSAEVSGADIVQMIQKHFFISNGKPSDGIHYGVYIAGPDGLRLYFLVFVDGAFGLRYTGLFREVITGNRVVALEEGSYSLITRAHERGRLYKNNVLRISNIRNMGDQTLSINFFVPASAAQPIDQAEVHGQSRYRFYPRVSIQRYSDESQLVAGAECIYHGSVTIWRKEADQSFVPVYGLAWIYAHVHFRWRFYEVIDPNKDTQSHKLLHTEETKRWSITYRWPHSGEYMIQCEAWVTYEETIPRIVMDQRRDKVMTLEEKQAFELAGLENQMETSHQQIWSSSATALLGEYEKKIQEEGQKPKPNQALLSAMQEALHGLEKQLKNTTSVGPFPIHAIFTDRNTGRSIPIALFVGPVGQPEHGFTQTWLLIDVTYPAFYETHRGTGITARQAIMAAFEAGRTRFFGHYPPGRILYRLKWPGMERYGLLPDNEDHYIETESWQRSAGDWLSISAQAVGAVAMAAAFVFPPTSLVVGGLLITGAVLGATVSIMHLIERADTNSFEWDANAIADIVNIAASFALIGGAVTRGMTGSLLRTLQAGEEVTAGAAARIAQLAKFQRGFLFMGLGGDISNGIVLSYDTYKQMRDLDAMGDERLSEYERIYPDKAEARRRWETDRYTRILGIIARAALNGALTIISIRSSKKAISEHVAPSTPPPGHIVTPVPAAIAGAANPNEYLAAVRGEMHPPGSAGRSWDHSRFPTAPQGTEWRVGDPINMPGRGGIYPTYDTARGRYWQNRAHFEMEGRARGEVVHDPLSQDPMRRMSDQELSSTRDTGTVPFAPSRPNQKMELEHDVPQRLTNWLEALGFSKSDARRLTGVSDPRFLMETDRLGHAFFDYYASNSGSYRSDITGQRFTGTATADIRRVRPAANMTDDAVTAIINEARQRNFNFNRSPNTRKLRDALNIEITERSLNLPGL